MTVGELLERMDAQELAEWNLYDRVRASEAEAQRKHAEMMQKRRR
jgi:hypothetical protein